MSRAESPLSHGHPIDSRRIRLRDRLERKRGESVVRPVVVHSARTAVAAVASGRIDMMTSIPRIDHWGQMLRILT